MKKVLFLLPLLAFLVVGCQNNSTDDGGDGGDDGGDDLPQYSLIAEYDFTQNGHSSTGTALTAETALVLFNDSFVSGGTNKLTSIGSDLSAVYDGNATGGAFENTPALIKMGKSGGNGNITLNFAAATNIAKAVVSCHDWYAASDSYPTNSNSLVVNGESQLAPYTTTSTPGELTYEFETASDVLTISTNYVDTSKGGRVFLFSLAIYTLE